MINNEPNESINYKRSNLVQQLGFDRNKVYSISRREDFDLVNSTNIPDDCLLDCFTYDARMSIDLYNKVKHKFKKIISMNILIDDKKHIVWDSKIGQLQFYLDNVHFFNRLVSNNVKFLRLKNYLFLTNHIRFERIEIFDHLCKSNLIENGLINFPSLEKTLTQEVSFALTPEQEKVYLNYDKDFLPLSLDFLPKDNFTFEKKHTLYENNKWVDVPDYGCSYNPLLYQNVYFEVLSETYYYTTEFPNKQINWISEKTIKPIINLLPHFCLTQQDYYSSLERQFGLTFNSEIFKSIKEFDSLPSGYEKTKTFINSIDYLLKMDKKTLHELYVDALPELRNNQNLIIQKYDKNYIKNKINE